jgi:hypothetical protein
MEIDPGTVHLFAIEALRLDVRRRLLGEIESGFAGGEHRLCGHLREREPDRFALEVQIRFEVVLLGRVSQELAA